MSRRVAPVAAQEGARNSVEPVPVESPEPPKVRAKRPAQIGGNDLGPIIKSKIQPPALRQATLSRQRLIDRLIEATSHRLTLLVAEAGYGKTTLLADFARVTTARVLWYRLDSADGEVVDWTNHLIASAREMEPAFGSATVALLREIPTGGPPKDAFVTSLVSELGGLEERRTVLILDDFHTVDESVDANDFVRRLVRDAPPWLAVVLSSRRQPDIELSRLAAEGDLVEIGTDDLRFSAAEIADLFADTFSYPLDDDVLSVLGQRTMGWIASLQLFHRSIQGRSPAAVRALTQAISGAESPIYDFLAEEVVDNLPLAFESILVRTSLLSQVSVREVAVLSGGDSRAESARTWIEEADRLGLLTRSSRSSDQRELHPLLREFLLRRLRARESETAISEIHMRLGHSMASDDPLTASYHFIEGGAPSVAMQLLGDSVLLTVGSGRWSFASDLVSKLSGVSMDPAVAAIRARQLMALGDIDGAEAVLSGIDVSHSTPDVRAVFRHTQVSLGWRSGNRELMFQGLTEIEQDVETPPVLRDIAEVLLDASPVGNATGDLPGLARRLRDMAQTMAEQKLTFYSAVGLHDSAVAYANAGDLLTALQIGSEALQRFGTLPFFASEQLSTHSLMAVCEQELGHDANSEAHRTASLGSGSEFADVPAEMSTLSTLLGDSEKAAELVTRGRLKQRQHLSDVVGDALLECAAAIGEFRANVGSAVDRLASTAFDSPLELGYSLLRDALYAQGLLLAERDEEAEAVAVKALKESQARMARRPEVRLAILLALARRDRMAMETALADAEASSQLAVLEVADAIVARAEWLQPIPAPIVRSIQHRPDRWLPAIRRQLESGNTPNARAAATLLDAYGGLEDVGLLRAYAKTYAKRGPGKHLGVALARRASPVLVVHDLGRVAVSVGDRTVHVTGMRRKSAATLMYLVTRPGFSANREQVVDALWPEADPLSASNNLNQSLYFLRREIDPWYEDGLSVDYIELQGDLVWLDRELVRADSSDFLAAVSHRPPSARGLASSVLSYEGRFAPEFEYDEWAMAWRGRIHSTFLDVANNLVDDLVASEEFRLASDVAGHVIQVDPEATDVEAKLVWIYGRLGRVSAARNQYEHLKHQERLDGLESAPLSELLEGPMPT